ncbi:hypothetical protein B9T31_06250 [Acinetobacter sp. ANC 4558]|uniref:putative type VI secretion system effector n=1 Tax=Acinetobacter sp. ANC 4558 TaxID=1977876 RepID=UPI000A35876A|nr:putative type VI secretion system effector [Acinetobacter sp. ANC 4558]OTG86603.1 hypothetical protein B9T31_06250 [Acinetobacter sp. ANC 4558]
MENLIKVEGIIIKLEIEDSKILQINSLEKQAAGTAFLGALTGSAGLMSNAPIMAMAAKGRDGKTFKGELSGIRVVGQFTGVKFENNTPLAMVVSEEQHEGYHFVYAVLDPKTGLLHMPYEMGRSVKKTYIKYFKYAIMFSIIMCVIVSIILIIHYFSEDVSIEELKFDLIYSYLGGILFSFVFFTSLLFFGKNNLRYLGKLSESVFEKLNFSEIKEQDFYSITFYDKEGFYPSVMEYRKYLIGKDPYPADYFDKKEESKK